MFALLAFALGSLSADPAFTEGCALYDQLEYEQAVFRFQEVALRQDLAVEDRAVVLAWLGLSYAGTGNMESARRSFVDAARAWPEVALPVEVSPSLAQLFEDARQGAATPLAPPPPPAETPPPPAPAPSAAPILPWVGVVAGSAVLVGGLGLLGLSAATFDGAKDQQLYQTDAKAQLDVANLEIGAAYALIPVGVAIAAASAWFLMEGGTP